MSKPLEDAYIVLDPSPRFMEILLVTFDKAEAKALVATDPDYVIIQKSGKEYPSSYRGY